MRYTFHFSNGKALTADYRYSKRQIRMLFKTEVVWISKRKGL